MAASDRRPARTLERLTPICLASPRSGGNRWPGPSSPRSIRRRRWATTCSVARRSAGRPRVGCAATEVIPLRRREDLSPPKGVSQGANTAEADAGLVRPSAQSRAAEINGRAASRRRVDGLHDLDASTALFAAATGLLVAL